MVKSGSKTPSRKVGTQASPDEHKAAVHKALVKWKTVPQPTAQEKREAKQGLAKLGANIYRKNLVGNSTDRKKRRQKLYDEFGDGSTCPCIYCGIRVGEGTLEQDKILTTAQGGRYRMPNLVPSCSSCNKARSDTPFSEIAKALEEQHGAPS